MQEEHTTSTPNPRGGGGGGGVIIVFVFKEELAVYLSFRSDNAQAYGDVISRTLKTA